MQDRHLRFGWAEPVQTSKWVVAEQNSSCEGNQKACYVMEGAVHERSQSQPSASVAEENSGAHPRSVSNHHAPAYGAL